MNEVQRIDRAPRSVSTTFAKPLEIVVTALELYRYIKSDAQHDQWHYPHNARHVAVAKRVRNQRLPMYGEVQEASNVLMSELRRKLDRRSAATIIASLYRALGAKPGDDPEGLIEGSLDAILESDRLGRVTDAWKPIGATPAVVAIAAKKILQTAIFAPKPAELAQACRDARHTLEGARGWCDSWLEDLQKADAILLEFAHDDWERPYLLPEHRPMLEPMLRAHYFADVVDEAYAGPFQEIVEREQAKYQIASD